MVLARACNLEKQGAVGPRFKVSMAQDGDPNPGDLGLAESKIFTMGRGWKAKLE